MTEDTAPTELSPPARALLDAVIAMSTDLDLHSVLQRIIVSAAELTEAQYAALGVIGGDGGLVDFITTGIDDTTRALIGDLPRGRGILRLLIDEPQTIRLESLHDHPKSFGFPENHPPMGTFLGVPVRVRGTVFGNLYLTEKTGGRSFNEQDEVLVQALASAAGFVIENARAYGLSERRRQWLEAAAELSEVLQPPVDLQSALVQITNAARGISGASATALVQFPDGDAPVVSAVDGPRASQVTHVLDRVAQEIRRNPKEIVDLDVDGTRTIALPLRAHLATPGVLVALFEKGHRPHDYEERELLASFAEQAALALDRAQAVADREELAIVSDRDRIARDLHDVVIQRLFATGLQLQGMLAIAVNPEVAERIDNAVRDLDLTIRDIRTTIFELQNRQPSSLRAAMRNLVKEYVPVLGFTPTLHIIGPLDSAVSETLGGQLLAVLREAVSNVAKHALADHAEVEVRVADKRVELCVRDDGTGVPEDRVESGLRNARRRANTLGGTCEVRHNEPRGTVFTWCAPTGAV